MNTLEVSHISKSYGDNTVLNDVTFLLHPGEVVGLIGKNGAGKSTLMKILVDLIKCDAGFVRICGKDIKEQREACLKHTSVMIEGPSLYPYATVKEHLKLNAYLRNLEDDKVKEALDYLNFGRDSKKKIGKCSIGMKQEIALAICFMNDPELYVLDEPINGLDFDNVVKFRKKVKELKDKQKSFLISSHILRELEVVADRYLFLENGKLVEMSGKDVSDIEETYEEIIHGEAIVNI